MVILLSDALPTLPSVPAVDEGVLVQWDGGWDHVEHGSVRGGALSAGVAVPAQGERRAEVPEAVQAAVGRRVVAVLEEVRLQQLIAGEPLRALVTRVGHRVVLTVPGHVSGEVLPAGEVQAALPARVDPVAVPLEEGVDLLLAQGPLPHQQVLVLLRRLVVDERRQGLVVGETGGVVARPRHERGVVGGVVGGLVGVVDGRVREQRVPARVEGALGHTMVAAVVLVEAGWE